MKPRTYINRKGQTCHGLTMTAREANRVMFDGDGRGLCVACGAEAYGVEPDARRYTCDVCGEARVYGLEEMILMGAAKVA